MSVSEVELRRTRFSVSHLTHPLNIDDKRTVDTHEIGRAQPTTKVVQRLSNEIRLILNSNIDIVAGTFNELYLAFSINHILANCVQQFLASLNRACGNPTCGSRSRVVGRANLRQLRSYGLLFGQSLMDAIQNLRKANWINRLQSDSCWSWVKAYRSCSAWRVRYSIIRKYNTA